MEIHIGCAVVSCEEMISAKVKCVKSVTGLFLERGWKVETSAALFDPGELVSVDFYCPLHAKRLEEQEKATRKAEELEIAKAAAELAPAPVLDQDSGDAGEEPR